MSTETDYDGIVDAVAAQLKAFSGLQGVRIEVEQDPVLGLPDDGGRAIGVESARRRPSEGQSMAAGTRLRNRFTVIISAVGFDMESFRAAARKRDGLIGQIELAILADRSIGNHVANLEIMGGEFYRASAPGNAGPFASVAETLLDMDVLATS